MLKSKYRWNLLYENPVSTQEQLIEVLLNNRQVTDMLLYFDDEGGFHDPFLFKDMKKAVERINKAIIAKEKILLYGDYDVDGVTGTAILYKTIKSLGGNVSYFLPDRFIDGYGPSMDRFKEFVCDNYSLIITIDNGISGFNEAKYLLDCNLDFIITDHHELGGEIPHAYAIIHPKLGCETYPFKDLSGCGVAFKLAHALLNRLPVEYLDLAALGTYADIVCCQGENRQILKAGLKQLSRTNNCGLRMLIKQARATKIDEDTIGFVLAPRLNAPGRMEHGSLAVQLLVTEDNNIAEILAGKIEMMNNERKSVIDVIMKEATELIEANGYDKDNVIVLCKESWHEGVLGIIANRLVDIYHKPVVLLTLSDELYKGSARTVEDFPLYQNLKNCADILLRFGGHKMAAGLSLNKDKVGELRVRLNDMVKIELVSSRNVDCEIELSLINEDTITKLSLLRPYGEGNRQPVFLMTDLQIVELIPLSNNKHLRLLLKKGDLKIEGIVFGCGNLMCSLSIGDCIDVIGTLGINEYNNKTTSMIFINDIRCIHKQIFDIRSKQLNYNLSHQYLYFRNNYGYNNSYSYDINLKLAKDIVIIDIPDSVDSLREIMKSIECENVYVMFKCDSVFDEEDLLTRDKLAKLYQLIKRYQPLNTNREEVYTEFKRFGFTKKLVLLSFQVFFELKFVIIENNILKLNEVIEKRDLTESKTYRELQERIKLKEKLLLSTSSELKEFLINL